MPEWFLSALAAAAMGGLVQGLVGMRMIGKMEARLSRLDIDVTALQRDKLDIALYDAKHGQIEAEIRFVNERHTQRNEHIEHKVRGVDQRVTVMEQRSR